MSMNYSFLPWTRQGVATAIRAKDTLKPGMVGRVSLPVSLRVNDRADTSLQVQVELYGPDDITGIDARQVVRTEPVHYTANVEPNYFPAVEFDSPDFPWLFTPAASNNQGRLRPWICLVVVRKQEGVTLTADPERPLPVLGIKAPARPDLELPDLGESWCWAHTQVVTGNNGQAIDELLAKNSEKTVSRLLCPRELEPNSEYVACIVPTFNSGRKVGLGDSLSAEDTKTLTPAWTSGTAAPPEVLLPVYYHWEFGTGVGGDFESLVRLLQARPLPEDVGVRDMGVQKLGFGLKDLGLLRLGGALRPPNYDDADEAKKITKTFKDGLRKILNIPGTRAKKIDTDPIVAPPVYGGWQAAQSTVPSDTTTSGESPESNPTWLRELNLDPRHRAAAGLGTLIVQDQQEQLMASAWQQFGEIERLKKKQRHVEVVQEVGKSVYNKRLKAMSQELLFHVSRPVHSRIRVATRTVFHEVGKSRLPNAASSGTFRRIVRSRSPIMRKLMSTIDKQTRPPLNFIQRMAGGHVASAPPLAVSGVIKSPSQRPTMEIVRPKLKVDIAVKTPDRPAAGFREAATEYHDYFMNSLNIATPPLLPILPFANIESTLLAKLNPEKTATTIGFVSDIPLDGQKTTLSTQDDSAKPTSQIPELDFPQPMYEALRDISQDLLLPGLEKIPPNTVTLLETNPEFVESYLIGLNHEMGREFLWREFPVDQGSTYFRQFWDVRAQITSTQSSSKDIPPVGEWQPENSLGANFKGSSSEGNLVLLIRGELLRRYPTAVIYAVRAVWTQNNTRKDLGQDERYPRFQGTLKPDVTFLGFNLTEAEARGGDGDAGWFFVIQQQPTEPRFGLDVTSSKPTLTSWNDLSWEHIKTRPGGYINVKRTTAKAKESRGLSWGSNSAHMAAITLQRPVRIAIHADKLLPTEQDGNG